MSDRDDFPEIPQSPVTYCKYGIPQTGGCPLGYPGCQCAEDAVEFAAAQGCEFYEGCNCPLCQKSRAPAEGTSTSGVALDDIL